MAVQSTLPTSKLPPTVRYAEAEYWESRYKREPAVFEWFFGHTALRRIIRAYISKKKPVLQVGCGTSNLQEGMAQSGYSIVNTDISQVVISQMKERHAKYSNMTYQVSDCRNMPEFMDCQFGSVIDKGTIDALLCCKQGTDNVMRMLKEVHRVLQPGGTFLLVTLGDPTRRLPLLLHPSLNWKVSLLLLPKISAACQAYVDGKPINDTVRPIEADGPYEVLGPDTIVGLPPGVQYSNFFFAYVCKTQPLQLPLAQGQKAQLPNGWVAGSKELFQKLQKELGLPEDLLAKGRRKRVVLVPSGSSSSMTGLCHSSQPSSTASSSNAATAYGTPKKYDQGLSPGREDQQQLAGAPQGAHQPIPTPLQQLQQQRQQQQAAVTKLEELLAVNAQRRQNASQQLPAVSGMDTQDIPTRPASAPNLANLVQHSAAAAATAAATASAAAAVGMPPAAASLPARDDVQILQVGEPVACTFDGCSNASHAGKAVQPCIASEAASAAVAGSHPPSVAAASLGNTSSDSNNTSSAATAVAVDETVQLLDGVSAGAAGVPLHPQQGVQQPLGSTAAVQLAAGAAAPAGGQQSWELQGRQGLIHSAPGASTQAGPAAAAQEQQQWSMLGRPSPAEAAATAAGDPPIGWSMLGRLSVAEAAATAAGSGPAVGAPLIPPVLRPGTYIAGRVPRLRRFSTDSPAIRLAAFSTQLALLRQQQSLHSERAADGLVMHDVAANEACGGAAAAAALAAAMSWGRTRPPRCRRLSAVSNTSFLSSTSISATGEDDFSEMTDEFASLCTTTAESQLVPEEAEEELSEAAADGTPVEASGDNNAVQSLSSGGPGEVAAGGRSTNDLVETLTGCGSPLSNGRSTPVRSSTPLGGRQSPIPGPGLGPGIRPCSSGSRRNAELHKVPGVEEQGMKQKQGQCKQEHRRDELQYRQQQQLQPTATMHQPQPPEQAGINASLQRAPAAGKACNQRAALLPQSAQPRQQATKSNVPTVH